MREDVQRSATARAASAKATATISSADVVTRPRSGLAGSRASSTMRRMSSGGTRPRRAAVTMVPRKPTSSGR
jgi:hypothetical protein